MHGTDASEGFFDRRPTHDTIEHLGRQGRLTLFAGAGVSISRGNPDWGRLVARLLAERFREISQGFDDTSLAAINLEQLAQAIVDSNDPAAIASSVEELFFERYPAGSDTHLRNRVFDLLYEQWAPRDSLASAIAKLAIFAKTAGRDVHIVTTNFDDNIETSVSDRPDLEALMEEQGFKLYPTSTPPRTSGNTIPIVHIHGLLGQEGPASEFLVFSERNVAEWMQDAARTAQRRSLSEYLIRRFSHSSVLFIGSSLRDIDIVHALFHTAETAKKRKKGRHAIVPLQDEVVMLRNRGLMSDVGLELAGRATVARLQHLGIEPIRPDFYGQVSQYLHEVSLCISRPDTYRKVSYPLRLRKWWESWRDSITREGELDAKTRHQKVLSSKLAEITDSGTIGQPGRAKIELWVRYEPDSRELVLWSSSDAIWVASDHPRRAPIQHGSKFAAVTAFAERGPVSGIITENPESRWTNFVACPVIAEEEPWLDLPIGVVCLLLRQSRPPRDGRLVQSATGKDITDLVADKLAMVGKELLIPRRARRR